MIGWLRLVLMIFYSPLRGIREARDRGSLLPISVIAVVSQLGFTLILKHWASITGLRSALWSELFDGTMKVVMVAIVFVPVLTLFANTFDRKGSFRVVLTQEYASLAGSMLYVLTATNIVVVAIAAFIHYSGIQAAYLVSVSQNAEQIRATFGNSALADMVSQQLNDRAATAQAFLGTPKPFLFLAGMVLAVKEAFRVSVLRALTVSVVSVIGVVINTRLWAILFRHVIGSPLLLIFAFLLLRGYFADFIGQQRARAAFKKNMELATLNPADASAHYNLGLLHQSRGELDAARERFEKAVQIDPDEIDANYQLGRIARAQQRYSDAIQHFEQVVSRNPAHAQYEIWREVAATYIAAGQYEDARTTLEQFLEHRPSDPEGLYLMGRAHAGLGHRREATSLM